MEVTEITVRIWGKQPDAVKGEWGPLKELRYVNCMPDGEASVEDRVAKAKELYVAEGNRVDRFDVEMRVSMRVQEVVDAMDVRQIVEEAVQDGLELPSFMPPRVIAQAMQECESKKVVLVGNPIDGMSAHGPFDTYEQACGFGEGVDDTWMVTPMEEP